MFLRGVWVLVFGRDYLVVSRIGEGRRISIGWIVVSLGDKLYYSLVFLIVDKCGRD